MHFVKNVYLKVLLENKSVQFVELKLKHTLSNIAKVSIIEYYN